MVELKFLLVFLPIFLGFNLFSQTSRTVSGTITDETSGEALIGASIFCDELGQGTVTNNYGFYSITLRAADTLSLIYNYLGFEAQAKQFASSVDLRLDVQLAPIPLRLDEVVVSADQNDDNIARPQMGVLDIPVAKIKEIPAIMGELDVLKIVQLLPGVQSGQEGTTGFHVRGGAADQNLVQLDEAIVYNPNHLFGLFSTFNTRAINNVTLIKGGFPAQYGGRLSSILDISMKEGNKKEYSIQGGIGLISTQLTVEGPIKVDKASFIVSGRRTYFDWLIKPFLPKSIRTDYVFYDLNAKVNWQVGEKDHIFVSAFRGKDDAFYSQDGIEYNVLFGNLTGTVRWNHIFSPKLFLTSSLILNQYEQRISAIQDNAQTAVRSSIQDIGGKLDFQYFPSPAHNIKFGFHFQDHEFQSQGDAGINSGLTSMRPELGLDSVPVKYFDEVALYFNDEVKLSQQVSVNFGIRIPSFLSKEVVYHRVEPRVSVKLQTGVRSSLKGSYTMMNQFLHLIPSSTAAVPTDVWVPSSKKTKPQQSQQFAMGYYQNFRNNNVEVSVEAYYKSMKNQVLFKEGNQLIQSLDVDDLLAYGEGWSYGTEWLIRKKSGRFTGWVAYTLSWTEQQFDDLNFGKKFPFRYDRRHDLSLVGSYQLTDQWTISGTFVYSSGSAFTVPTGRTQVNYGGSLFEGNYFIYETRNNVRLHPFHRLNVSLAHKKESTLFKKNFEREWVLSFYNIYSRQNPYFVYLQIDARTEQPRATQVSLLPIIPSITYNFKF